MNNLVELKKEELIGIEGGFWWLALGRGFPLFGPKQGTLLEASLGSDLYPDGCVYG